MKLVLVCYLASLVIHLIGSAEARRLGGLDRTLLHGVVSDGGTGGDRGGDDVSTTIDSNGDDDASLHILCEVGSLQPSHDISSGE